MTRALLIAAALIVSAYAAPASASARASGCDKTALTAEFKRLNAMCRDLGRRAAATAPGKDWEQAWSATCWADSATLSTCDFRIVHRDRGKGQRAPSRVCTGRARVTGRKHFRVRYTRQDSGCRR